MYSTIIKKTCKCGCGKPYSIGYNGYKFDHAPQEVLDKVGTKKMVADKNRANRNSIARKLHEAQNLANPELSHKVKLEAWFKMIELENTSPSINGYGGGCACWECSEWIPLGYIRHATAHIISKVLFPSVSTHPNNFLILGAGCGCHYKYDRSWEDASKMKVFKEAKKRFLTFADLISLEERRRIPEQFKQ